MTQHHWQQYSPAEAALINTTASHQLTTTAEVYIIPNMAVVEAYILLNTVHNHPADRDPKGTDTALKDKEWDPPNSGKLLHDPSERNRSVLRTIASELVVVRKASRASAGPEDNT